MSDPTANQLLQAIDRNQLLLHYQPIVDLQQSDTPIVGYEALVRWQHPDRGLLYPASFLPSQSIRISDFLWQKPLFDFVFEESCKSAKLIGDRYIAINVSPAMLAYPDFILEVNLKLGFYQLKKKICFEITEESIDPAIMPDLLTAISPLAQVVQVAIDDTGTGESSLARIKEMQGVIDFLKVDRSFLPKDPIDKPAIAVYQCFVDLAKALGMCSVAEGIENANQVLICQTIGVQFGQGYYFYKPSAELLLP